MALPAPAAEKKSFWKRIAGSGSGHNSSSSKQARDRTGLLTTDSDGRTPLHVALTSRAVPSDVLVQMIQTEPKAVAMANHRGRYPLHFAVVHRHDVSVIAELVDVYPVALAAADAKGLSPLAYAMEGAKRETDLRQAPRTFWMPVPDNSLEAAWQEEQGERWGIVHWLLLSSATHPQTSLSVNGDKPMLVDALIHAAPPAVISLLIGASVMLLSHANRATAFAGSTLYSCIARQYPLTILMSLVSQCPRDVQQVRDETGMGLVSSQYISGCFCQDGQDWRVDEVFFQTLVECIEDNTVENVDAAFRDWWDKMEFLISYCVGKMTLPKERLLHAALRNVDTPPLVIQLLLALYADSVSQEDEKEPGSFPLYIAASRKEYVPRYYERAGIEKLPSVLESVYSADKGAVTRKGCNDRLPLHAALAAGRRYKEIRPLVVGHLDCLSQADPVTKLFPFLLAAVSKEPDSFRLSCIARNSFSFSSWNDMSDRTKASEIIRTSEQEDLDQLSTTYRLLMFQPSVLERLVVSSQCQRAESESLHTHYRSWMCIEDEKGQWIHSEERAAVFKRALSVPLQDSSPNFVAWFTELENFIRMNHSKDQRRHRAIPDIPVNDNCFLLHMVSLSSACPSPLIELLLAIYPDSASTPLPESACYPLHLNAATQGYVPDSTESFASTSIDFLCLAFPEASKIRWNGQLPIHIALEHGKTLPELETLVNCHPSCLEEPDGQSQLLPFQLSAVHLKISPEHQLYLQNIARSQHDEETWSIKFSERERDNEARRIQKALEVVRLSTTFRLLRKSLLYHRAESLFEINVVHDESDSGAEYTSLPPEQRFLDVSSSDHLDAVFEVSGDRAAAGFEESESAEEDEEEESPLSSALFRHLSARNASAQQESGEDMFECDASVLSGIDVMSTMSNQPTPISSHRVSKASRLSSHHTFAQDSGSDDDFDDQSTFADDDGGYNDALYSVGEMFMDPQNTQAANQKSETEGTVEGPTSMNTSSTEDMDEMISFLIRIRPRIRSKLQGDGFQAVKLSKKASNLSVLDIAGLKQDRASPETEESPVMSKTGHSATSTKSGQSFVSLQSGRRESIHSVSSYRSLCDDDKAKLKSYQDMAWVEPQIQKTLLDHDSISAASGDGSLLFSTAADDSNNVDVHGSLKQADAQSSQSCSVSEQSISVSDCLPSSGSDRSKGPTYHLPDLKSNDKVSQPRNSLVPGISSYLGSKKEVSDAELDDPTEDSNAPSTLSYLDSSTTSTSEGMSPLVTGKMLGLRDRQKQSLALPIQEISETSSSSDVTVDPKSTTLRKGVSFAPEPKPRCNTPATRPAQSSTGGLGGAQAPKSKKHSTDQIQAKAREAVLEETQTEMYFDKVAMRWKSRPVEVQVSKLQSEPKASANRPSEALSDQNSMYFDKKAMRWRMRTVVEDVDATETDTRSGREATDSRRSTKGTSSVTPVVDALQRDALAFKSRMRPRANALNTPSDRQFRSTWRQMFDTSGKSMCCLVCNENGREVLMVPCRHLAMCKSCAVPANLKSCPLCHATSTDRIFLIR